MELRRKWRSDSLTHDLADLNRHGLGGGAAAAYTGIIYGPKSLMNFYGNAGLTAYTIIVSYRLAMNGTSDINNDYSSLPTGNPIKITALVE
jgi:hypothetical protein